MASSSVAKRPTTPTKPNHHGLAGLFRKPSTANAQKPQKPETAGTAPAQKKPSAHNHAKSAEAKKPEGSKPSLLQRFFPRTAEAPKAEASKTAPSASTTIPSGKVVPMNVAQGQKPATKAKAPTPPRGNGTVEKPRNK
jgi:hypothetical protein